MTTLCAGQTHVYRVGSTRCDCGAQANNPPLDESSARFDRRFLKGYMEFNFGVLPEWVQVGSILEYRRGNEVVLYRVVDRQGDRLTLASATITNQANPPIAGVYPFPASYVPNPHHPRYVPVAVPEIAASVKAMAMEAGASHISADGTKAFVIRLGECHQANWSQEDGCFLSWWSMGGDMLPCGVIQL